MKKELSSFSFKTEMSMFYDLNDPECYEAVPLLIALHGYGENKEKMMQMLNNNLNPSCIIASLQAPFPHIVPPVLSGRPIKYGFGWITSFNSDEAIRIHHTAINNVIADIKQNDKMRISKIVLLGFSQSVALNFRYTFSYPNKVNKLIAICGGLPGDWNNDEKYLPSNTDVLYVGCKKDLVYPPKILRENAEKLKTKSKSLNVKMYDSGHQIPLECFKEIDKLIAE